MVINGSPVRGCSTITVGCFLAEQVEAINRAVAVLDVQCGCVCNTNISVLPADDTSTPYKDQSPLLSYSLLVYAMRLIDPTL